MSAAADRPGPLFATPGAGGVIATADPARFGELLDRRGVEVVGPPL